MYFQGTIWSLVHRPILFGLIIFALGSQLICPGTTQAAGIPADLVAKAKAQKPEHQASIPEGLSPQEVDAYLAGISDQQARKMLADQLKQRTSKNQATGASGQFAAEDDPANQLFHKLNLAASIMLDEIASFFSFKEESSLNWQTILARLSGGRGSAISCRPWHSGWGSSPAASLSNDWCDA